MKTRTVRSGVFFFLFNGMLLGQSAVQVTAADYLFKPFISLSEEVTDNIYEEATGRRSDYITRIRPGATYRYQSPLWAWDAAYTFEYRNYARGSKGDEYNHDGSVKGKIALVDNFFFLDLSDTYKRVALDVARNAATETSLFVNQTDQNIAVISPYLLWRLRGDNTLKTGYSYTDTRYFGVNGTDGTGSSYRGSSGIDKQEHRGFADLSHDVTAKLNVTTRYMFTRLESDPAQYNKHDLSGSFKYEYADKSFLSMQLGNSWQQFDGGGNVSYLFWNASIIHDFNGVVGTVETKVVPTEDPLAVSTKETTYSARLDKAFQRGSVGCSASYSEYVNTEIDTMDHRRSAATATGRYEVMQNITATFATSVEKYNRQTARQQTTTDYPYRFVGSGGLSFAFNKELTLGLTYIYATERYGFRDAAGATEINKGVVEVKKTF
ncbi:MAG: TIGR03016 family PEP-CTERM system-associated outer membrane protein [Desulfuromonadaceae bacterium]|nr:TIGR03016 family PEP-CTERM system-associated outer membrane protein [Desulfuromonadaceae bacterium]